MNIIEEIDREQIEKLTRSRPLPFEPEEEDDEESPPLPSKLSSRCSTAVTSNR